jgi:hypothetical protein
MLCYRHLTEQMEPGSALRASTQQRRQLGNHVDISSYCPGLSLRNAIFPFSFIALKTAPGGHVFCTSPPD